MAHDLVPLSPTLDISGLGPIPQVPLVPEHVLRQHHCFVPGDHRFKAACPRETRARAPGYARSPDRGC
jgi:hypothetical protein